MLTLHCEERCILVFSLTRMPCETVINCFASHGEKSKHLVGVDRFGGPLSLECSRRKVAEHFLSFDKMSLQHHFNLDMLLLLHFACYTSNVYACFTRMCIENMVGYSSMVVIATITTHAALWI